jgi:hypothetical protein
MRNTITLNPTRMVLDGVPKINFYEGGERCPEDLTLPSVMRALLEYQSDPEYGCKKLCKIGHNCRAMCSYSFFVGVTGIGFYLSWKEGWADDNNAYFYMEADPLAGEKRAMAAAGFHVGIVHKKDPANTESDMRTLIRDNLSRGWPLIGYGVIGPPETVIITGYDEGGDVLIGWSFFQNIPPFNTNVEYEPSGYFRKRDWFNTTEDLLAVTSTVARPKVEESYRIGLETALKVGRTPMVRPEPDAPAMYQVRHNGLAAYTAWSKNLLHDDDFPTGNDAVLRAHYEVHNNAVGQVAEARWYMGQFLIEAVDHLHYHAAESLLHAAAYCAAEHDLMWDLWNLAGGIGNPEGHQFLTDPVVRRKMAEVVQAAREKDALALEAIEKALSNL